MVVLNFLSGCESSNGHSPTRRRPAGRLRKIFRNTLRRADSSYCRAAGSQRARHRIERVYVPPFSVTNAFEGAAQTTGGRGVPSGPLTRPAGRLRKIFRNTLRRADSSYCRAAGSQRARHRIERVYVPPFSVTNAFEGAAQITGGRGVPSGPTAISPIPSRDRPRPPQCYFPTSQLANVSLAYFDASACARITAEAEAIES